MDRAVTFQYMVEKCRGGESYEKIKKVGNKVGISFCDFFDLRKCFFFQFTFSNSGNPIEKYFAVFLQYRV